MGWFADRRARRRFTDNEAVLVALPDRNEIGAGWATAADIARAAQLPARRSGAALRRLLAAGLVEVRPHPTIAHIRQYRYVRPEMS